MATQVSAVLTDNQIMEREHLLTLVAAIIFAGRPAIDMDEAKAKAIDLLASMESSKTPRRKFQG
jgi:hypothetical protein